MAVMKEFRDFILRGNVVDLAVGVIIGAAFGAVVDSLVKDIITPILAIPGTTNFSELVIQVGGAKFLVGNFINTIVSFLVIAFVIFFFVVRPVNALMKRFKPSATEPETTHDCPYCLSKVPLAATRCAFCTSELKPAASA